MRLQLLYDYCAGSSWSFIRLVDLFPFNLMSTFLAWIRYSQFPYGIGAQSVVGIFDIKVARNFSILLSPTQIYSS